MGYFDDWFDGAPGHYFEDLWWDPVTTTVVVGPPSSNGGVSKSQILGTTAPRPALPPWRGIAGPTGNALTDIRRVLAGTLQRDENWGNHVDVTFTAANTPVPVDTGLGGAAKGYHVVRSDTGATVFDAHPGVPDSKRGVLWLQASAPCRVLLYIY